ncbi:N-6 DNA methylase [Candidatus Saccharibacteria bacterium]|nr:N-6 DNA methylase [Candidatus Saccharibacteria bacterium]
MELKELTEKTCDLFNISSIGQLGGALMECVLNNDIKFYEAFIDLVKDLEIDWMQKIYQYYLAERKDKMQDYTPKSIAKLMAILVGEAQVMIDMCAGSGALTIQRWCINRTQKFDLYEFDENVIPFLLFNLTVRNIRATVYQSDVLQEELMHKWIVRPGEKYGIVEVIK